MGFFYYIIYTVFGIIIEKGTFSWYKRNMENKVKKLKGHFIICGYGRLGKYTTERLQAEKIPFVIVENSPDVIEELKNRDILFIEGNAMDEETLEKANIKKAKALASLLHEDADNLYVIMTAKELNPDIFIVTKAEDKIGEKRLIKAGADRVILPYEEGGAKIAFSLLRPNLREFLELALRGSHLEYQIEELKVEKGSFLSGKTIRDSGLKKNFGMIAIGIIKKGKMLFNPDPETKIEENDILILLGEKDKFEKLSEKA
jgi:voltage-gated potassium channel